MKMTNELGAGVFFCPTKNWGGIEKNVRLRAKYFGEKGYHIYVVVLKGTYEDRFKNLQNVKVKTILKRGGDLNFFVVLTYFQFLKKVKPKMVFAALKRDWWLVSLAAYFANVPNKVLYLGNKRKIRKGLKYKAVFNILKSKVLVNSNSLKTHLLSSTDFFNDKNLFRIYNGIELPSLTGEKKDYGEILGLKKNTFIVGCAGWLNLRKGFDLLPEILRKLPETIHIVHVGNGGFELDVPKMVSENEDIAHRLHFLGHESQMDSFFRGIDVFMLCSRSEGMANVLNEALSHGKPIVSTRVPGSEELLDNGKYGILTPIENTTAIAKGIQDIYEGTINFTAENQRKRITDNFSLKQMMQETELLFFS